MVAVLVLIAGVAPAVAFELTRRHAQASDRRDSIATVRRHRDFLDGLGAATRTTAGASSRS
jgi:hypothetical protein